MESIEYFSLENILVSSHFCFIMNMFESNILLSSRP